MYARPFFMGAPEGSPAADWLAGARVGGAGGAWRPRMCDVCQTVEGTAGAGAAEGGGGGEVRVKSCTACKVARYCGSACQRHDWVKHKPACLRAQGKPVELVVVNNVRPVIRRFLNPTLVPRVTWHYMTRRGLCYSPGPRTRCPRPRRPQRMRRRRRRRRCGRRCRRGWMRSAGGARGRGLHSSTFQFNLSRLPRGVSHKTRFTLSRKVASVSPWREARGGGVPPGRAAVPHVQRRARPQRPALVRRCRLTPG
jgi:hypothetical protein